MGFDEVGGNGQTASHYLKARNPRIFLSSATANMGTDMNIETVNDTTSPFPRIRNEMLDRLTKEADGRTLVAQSSAGGKTEKKAAFFGHEKRWLRTFF